MDTKIIPLEGTFSPEEARDWEANIFRQVCSQAQKEATAYLQALDDALLSQRPPEWVVIGFRERTLVTRFGEVRIRRRLYQDPEGAYHFLLDEYLGLKAYQAATPEMQAMCTTLAGHMSFRTAAGMLEEWLAGLLSHSSCWRLLQRTGQAAICAEKEAVEAVFDRGELEPITGERPVQRLYMEADGVHVRLQDQTKRHMEIRSAIAYEGWERLPTQREAYRLSEKRVYCHASKQFAFWEGVSLAWARKWDLTSIQDVILNGDGAKWIRTGVEQLPGAIWQLDGFHLARDCGRAFGTQADRVIYRALREGRTKEAQGQMDQTPVREGKQAQRASRWVLKVAQETWGLDWRIQKGLPLNEARGLGSIEGNQAQLLAKRMKDKGRSWSPAGAYNMAKVQELLTNDKIKSWCYQGKQLEKPSRRYDRRRRSTPIDLGQWLQASVPALHGPAANKPWTQWLRHKIHPPHLLN